MSPTTDPLVFPDKMLLQPGISQLRVIAPPEMSSLTAAEVARFVGLVGTVRSFYGAAPRYTDTVHIQSSHVKLEFTVEDLKAAGLDIWPSATRQLWFIWNQVEHPASAHQQQLAALFGLPR